MGTYRLSLAPSPRRVLVEGPPRGLPLAVATAVIEFLTGALLDDPQKIGQPSPAPRRPMARMPLAGYQFVRRGAYRVVYRIDDAARTVHVIRIDHRSSAYRARNTAPQA
jgi:mRNA interferase RelE/StbE